MTSAPLRSLQLSLTDDCNFDCVYCYRRAGRSRMRLETARRAVDYFLPRSSRSFQALFFGGEPLLEFPLLAEIVPFIRIAARAAGRRPRFGLTTNGSLGDDRIVAFLESQRFRVGLSYDGAAHDAQRAPGSRAALDSLLDRLLPSRRISLETNSVFTPESVSSLADTVLDLVERGIPSVRFALSFKSAWPQDRIAVFGAELTRLRRAMVRMARKTGRFPLRNFTEAARPRERACSAGRDRISVDPRGGLWGCAVFSDWARGYGGPAAVRRYRIGRIGHPPGLLDAGRAAAAAKHARFSTAGCEAPAGPCGLCPDRGRCWICPAAAAMAGGGLHEIPGFVCDLLRLQSRAAARFAADISS
ncbi:MAG: hypothetical protein PHI34_02490 [Acidobacteriota bacterium]|nr:hypothetical protein [Acidobacteriota bacterium]